MRRWRRAHLSASTGPVQHRLALQASRTFASPRRAGGRLAHHSQQAHHPQLRPNCSGIEPFPLASPCFLTPPACASVLNVCNGGFACTGCAPLAPACAPLPPNSSSASGVVGGGCGEACINRTLNLECVAGHCPSCTRDDEDCGNQRFARKQGAALESKRAGAKGFGLFSKVDLAKGQFIIEYVGEVLEEEEYARRKNFYAEVGQVRRFFFSVFFSFLGSRKRERERERWRERKTLSRRKKKLTLFSRFNSFTPPPPKKKKKLPSGTTTSCTWETERSSTPAGR